MNGDAVLMMALAMLILWGGLLGALLNLSRHPEASRATSAPPTTEPLSGPPEAQGAPRSE